ncbi:Phostensin [Tupaia chinensis]|uniref:Phostensin n=1 Tax=Tupaia chinensis TaxID=246437 RepID=L9L389_TUPCH|nr:Phostensin [Tupaia chinensis]
MATIPDWKLQLLGQEEASVRGREMAERERLSQMPAWKRGLLERRRAKLGLPPGDPSPVLGTAEAGPPDPDESAVLLEAIGPVHQNRFIRQERQQQMQRTDPAVPGAGKKRYPTAEEILVLGGYLRLSRSCLAKGSPERHHKQLKISFSETALETTYQYPSESSVLEELGPEPEAPSAPSPPAAQPDDDDDEEELLLQRELQGGLRTKALIVDESCRR